MKCYPFYALLLASLGCHMTPVPRRTAQFHEQARREVPVLEQIVQPGDIVFRLSNTELAGGLVDFSQAVAKCTESYLSHAAIIYHVGPDGAMIVDMTPQGIQRRYVIDWYVDGTKNLVVRRLKPEYRFLIPRVLDEMDKLLARDVMYDDKFDPDNDRYYCTELVDRCFREVGYPLAPLIRIRDFPQYDLLMSTGCLVGGIDTRNLAAVAGNEHIGLFSSPMLETVMDLRGRDTSEIQRFLPRAQLVERKNFRNIHSDRELPPSQGSDPDTPLNSPAKARGGAAEPQPSIKTAG